MISMGGLVIKKSGPKFIDSVVFLGIWVLSR